MNTAARALAWQVWWRHRVGLAVVFILVLAVSATFQMLPEGAAERKHGGLTSMQFVFALIYVAAVFGYGFEVVLESGASGFPARQFTLPVRTWVLVGWPMLQGMAAVALLCAAWAQFVLRPTGFDVKPWAAALHGAAGVGVLQALLWWPVGVPWLRVAAAVLVLPVLALAPTLADALGIGEAWVPGLFAVLIPLSYLAAVVGVGRARGGDGPAWAWDAPTRAKTGSRPPRRLRPFASPARALGWYERRRNALWYPLAVACCMVLHLGVSFAFADAPENRSMRLAANFLFAPLVLAPMLSSSVGGVGASAGNPMFAPFLATRPVATADWVAAKLRSSAWSVVAGWTVTGIAFAIWFVGLGMHRDVPGWWGRMRETGQAWRVGGAALLGVAVLWALTWRLGVNNLWLTLTGRVWVTRASLLANGVLLVGAAILASQMVSHPESFQPLFDALPWLMGVAVALKLTLAVWVLRATVRSGLLRRETVAKLLGVWLLAAVGLFALASVVIPSGRIAVWELACGVILLLPLARLSATPLALAWNRHR